MKYTQKYLKSIFEYDKKDGELIWKYNTRKQKCWNTRYSGKIAGCSYTSKSNNRKYKVVGILNRTPHLHRIIWIYHHGSITPQQQIDHIDGDGLNNRIENLRLVSHQENHKNIGIPKNNKSGYIGVSFVKKTGKWRSYIVINAKQLFLGSFKTKQEAITARKKAEIKFGFHPNHGRAPTN